LSTAPSADDQESDRLRKEIVASLTPVHSVDPSRNSLQPGTSPGVNRASSILPAEYDSYWADGGERATPRQSQDSERHLPSSSTTAAVPTTQVPNPSLLNRFSWEANNAQAASPDGRGGVAAVPEPVKTSHEDTIPAPAVERAAEEERQQWSEDLPDHYFGPGHTITVTKPDPATEPNHPVQEFTPPAAQSLFSSPPREQTRSPGLHVVNSAINPEAVDLPPRLSADLASPTHTSDGALKPLPQELNRELPNPAISTSISASVPPAPGHDAAATSPTSGKPLGAREIATISSAAERIATYNQTREHWATHDAGLQGWLQSTLEANPDLMTQIGPVQRTSTGTVRHKNTASISLLGKFGSSSANQPQGAEQQQSTFTQAPVGEGSPTTGAPSSSGAGYDRRAASRQFETKGKDLLHTANVLSGKGLTSAKGLFAKGKSRFGREKVEK
jgi:hypothetical protein